MNGDLFINVTDALKERYKIRTIGPDNKYYTTSIPRQVVEREAERRGLTLSDFCDKFELEVLYNSFEGVHYRFVLKVAKAETE